MAESTGVTVKHESGSHPHHPFLCRILLEQVLQSPIPR